MKLLRILILTLAGFISSGSASAQNILFNLLAHNTGLIKVGGNSFLEISICNTDPVDFVQAFKLRPQISVPVSIVGIADSGHILPTGWKIIFNSGKVIRLSNATDMIPSNTCRTILIAIKGNTVGGPYTVSGNLLFSNGTAPGSDPGSSIANDNPADNSSTTSCKVIN